MCIVILSKCFLNIHSAAMPVKYKCNIFNTREEIDIQVILVTRTAQLNKSHKHSSFIYIVMPNQPVLLINHNLSTTKAQTS